MSIKTFLLNVHGAKNGVRPGGVEDALVKFHDTTLAKENATRESNTIPEYFVIFRWKWPRRGLAELAPERKAQGGADFRHPQGTQLGNSPAQSILRNCDRIV